MDGLCAWRAQLRDFRKRLHPWDFSPYKLEKPSWHLTAGRRGAPTLGSVPDTERGRTAGKRKMRSMEEIKPVHRVTPPGRPAPPRAPSLAGQRAAQVEVNSKWGGEVGRRKTLQLISRHLTHPPNLGLSSFTVNSIVWEPC